MDPSREERLRQEFRDTKSVSPNCEKRMKSESENTEHITQNPKVTLRMPPERKRIKLEPELIELEVAEIVV